MGYFLLLIAKIGNIDGHNESLIYHDDTEYMPVCQGAGRNAAEIPRMNLAEIM